MTRKEKQEAARVDREIERIYRANCAGIQISVLDIPKVFEAGRKAHVEGRNVRDAIVSFVDSIAKRKTLPQVSQ